MGFGNISGALSKHPTATGTNRITSGASNSQALAVRANAGQDASTYIQSVEDPAGVPVFGILRYGKTFFQGQTADPASAKTEFWQEDDFFPRIALGYTAFGADIGMGSGAAQPDTTLSRVAPVGVATLGTLAQNGRVFERQGTFNVKDYGAVGNGATDDGPAFPS